MYVNFIYASKNKNQTTQDIEKISVKQNKQTKLFNLQLASCVGKPVQIGRGPQPP
jgi:hypothetical protein